MLNMKLVISLLIPLVTGAVAGIFTSTGVKGWYAAANKPSFNPPDWIFAPMWTTLYILMGFALYLVWKKPDSEPGKKTALRWFAIQMVLNFCWSFIFFYAQQPGWALVEIVAMWVAILFTIISFSKVSRPAAWLLVPYILWVSFATILNFYIWHLN